MMLSNADLAGLTPDEEDRLRDIHGEVMRQREEILVWHRLLDRRRLDRKLGLHPIPEFAVDAPPSGDEQGRLVKKDGSEEAPANDREPFYVRSEHEARAVLVRGIGYLSDADGSRFAFDKGEGDRDKAAAWIIKEINEIGAMTYIQRRSPHIFGIPLAVTSS